ncbi:MAG: hypothetical protein LBS36_01120 [Oscillospiraceae bacterium]|nr:hypothetical protein [Oscillospiraceae bacterium]
MKKIKIVYITALALVLALTAGAAAPALSEYAQGITGDSFSGAPAVDADAQTEASSGQQEQQVQTPAESSGSPAAAQAQSASGAESEPDSQSEGEEIGNVFAPAQFNRLVAGVSEDSMRQITPNKAVAGKIVTRGDKQYYTFTVTQRGYIELEFVHENVSGMTPCWNTYLYERYLSEGSGGEKQYRELTVLSASLDSEPAYSNRVGVYPGTYVLLVTNTTAYSSSEYILTAKFVQSNDYEAECNDSVYRYNEIYSGRPVKGSSSYFSEGKDLDYFMFEMKNSGYAELSFLHEDLKLPTVAWRVTLMDEDGSVLYIERSSLRETEKASGAIGLKKGIYFIEVASHEYNGAEYTLRLTAFSHSSYEAEPNDAFETANPLTNKTPVYGALTLRSSPMERDYYKISMPSRGYLQLSLDHEDLIRELDGWNIYIYNANRRVLYSDVSYWNTASVQSPKIGLPAGDYYICIDAENRHHNYATYKLTASYELTTAWEIEDNNSHDRANPITIGSSVRGALIPVNLDYDVDYFCFDVQQTTKIAFRFEHKNLNASYDGWEISLLDASRSQLKRIVSGWDEVSKTSDNVTLTPGRYYIKVDVDNGMSFSSEEYLLTLMLQ